MMTKVAALLIGQAPRPDLVDPLRAALPDCDIVEFGALDGLAAADLPAAGRGDLPLTTRLANGKAVTVSQEFLAPRLQARLDAAEAEGVAGAVLLCAGTFPELRGRRLLLKPFDIVRTTLTALGLRRIGLITPVRQQEKPLEKRWAAAGFEPAAWSDDLAKQGIAFRATLLTTIESRRLQGIVLDYVGHPAEQVDRLQQFCPIPVVDAGRLTVALAGEVFS